MHVISEVEALDGGGKSGDTLTASPRDRVTCDYVSLLNSVSHDFKLPSSLSLQVPPFMPK